MRHTYRPKNATLRATYEWFVENGHTRKSIMGGVSNAYCVAAKQGRLPAWVAPGTPAYAAAQAGMYNWRQAQEQQSRVPATSKKEHEQ